MARRKKRKYAKRGMRSKSSSAKHAFAKKLRSNMTKPEKVLWKRLSQKKLGVWFYAQKLVYGYICDFWCPACGLCVEVDGPHHAKRKASDKKRDAVLRRKGILTMRFPTKSVERSPEKVAAIIKAKVKQRT